MNLALQHLFSPLTVDNGPSCMPLIGAVLQIFTVVQVSSVSPMAVFTSMAIPDRDGLIKMMFRSLSTTSAFRFKFNIPTQQGILSLILIGTAHQVAVIPMLVITTLRQHVWITPVAIMIVWDAQTPMPSISAHQQR